MGEHGLRLKRGKNFSVNVGCWYLPLVQMIINPPIETQDIIKCLGIKKQLNWGQYCFFNQSLLEKKVKIPPSHNCLFEREKAMVGKLLSKVKSRVG